MSQALYRKWRPQRWDQVVGQEHIINTLQNAVRSQRVGHAYLFAGPRGTGKTTSARLLAKAVNCLEEDLGNRPCDQCQNCLAIDNGRFMDLIEIDAASNTSVDDVRDLRDKINFSPSQGRFKVYIIDEVHMLSTAAFNALLKTLEEPPPHAIFILATTEIHKIPATVLSRCQRHEFRRIPINDIVTCLQDIADKEKILVDDEALVAIARQSTGAMRDAISLLDQLASTGEKITLEIAQNVLGTATDQSILELVDAILRKNAQDGLACLHRALDGGSDARQFARQTVDYLRELLLIKLNNHDQIDATADMLAQMKRHANAFSGAALVETINAFNAAASDLRSAWQPSLPLELALAKVINLPDALPTQPAPATPVVTETTAPAAQPARAKTEHKPAKKAADPVEETSQAASSNMQEPVEPAAELHAAAQTTQVTQAQPSASAGEIDLEAIQKNWKNIRNVVREYSKPTEALLNSCKLVTVKKGVLVLGFSTSVLQSKMNTPENLELTRNAIAHLLGIQVPITTIVTRGRSTELPPDLDIEADGLVNAALNLGGQIVDRD
jgi:DNA polymerase-3 subunit gamma/tau